MTFEEMDWDRRFDGIWASASLLHVPRVDLPRIVEKFCQALRPGGVWYVSFKHGTSEREVGGRHFTDMTEETLRHELQLVPELRIVESWVSQDVRPGRMRELWLNALLCHSGTG